MPLTASSVAQSLPDADDVIPSFDDTLGVWLGNRVSVRSFFS